MRLLKYITLLFVLSAPLHAQTNQNYSIEPGLQAFQSEDYDTALENFTQGAMIGHALAQFNLGLMYHQGIGIEPDFERAMQLYALSAQQGIAQAQFNLGLMYDRGEGTLQDYREAYYWYLQAADQGDADGQYAVGTMNFYGQGRPENYAEAMRWYQDAARQGHRDAQYNLGVMHLAGLGIEANPTVALTWFEMAADNGSADAQYNAAMMYLNGQGVSRSPARARDFFEMAAEQNLRDAQTQLGMLYATGNVDVSRDFEQAHFWFNKAAHRGSALAQFFLGRIHAEGLGFEQSSVIGHMWYEIAYRFGYEQAPQYMRQLREQMDADSIEQAEMLALRWMIAYARRNPGSVRLRREEPLAEQLAPATPAQPEQQ
jgi:uncharacterized protein